MSAVPQFGLRRQDEKYIERPGAYAVALDDRGYCAVVQGRQGYFLLGGGIEPGETSEQALCREILEECGRSAQIVGRIGEALEYVTAPGEGCFKIQATYYHVTLGAHVFSATEADYTLVWLSPKDAVRLLQRDSAKWAVENLINTALGQPSRP